MPEDSIDHIDFDELNKKAISQPLVKHIYTADPSAHVFNGKIYIYPSHDVDAGDAFDDLGSHFAMEDYHVLSMDSPTSEAVDNGLALHVNDVPWAAKQMWAPDANEKDGKYYLFFPAKDHEGIFRTARAISRQRAGRPPLAEADRGSAPWRRTRRRQRHYPARARLLPAGGRRNRLHRGVRRHHRRDFRAAVRRLG